jgi:ketosteroid isomerase-like protein
MSCCWRGKLKTFNFFRIEDKVMLKLNSLAVCALTFLPIAVTAQTPVLSATQTQTANDHHADETAIEQVMKRYHAAILAHDGTALAGLFLPDANLWLNVLTDSAYARERSRSATARKVRVSNYQDFAKLVSTTPKSFDPEHSNVVIHTDGTIAAVYFDFVFNVDGKANNRGSETWQLVKAADGWRIASIIYSSEPPAQQQ